MVDGKSTLQKLDAAFLSSDQDETSNDDAMIAMAFKKAQELQLQYQQMNTELANMKKVIDEKREKN